MSNLFDIACLIYISVMNSTDQDFTYWQMPEDYDIATAYTGVCLSIRFTYIPPPTRKEETTPKNILVFFFLHL